MQDSEQIINRFSRRIYLKDRVGSAYIAPVREPNRNLKSLMEYLISTDPDTTAEEWARYFLKSLLESHKIYRFAAAIAPENLLKEVNLVFLKLCQELFFNYLQPVCWQAAVKINQMFKGSANIDLHYPVEECFTIACISVYQPTKLFKGFDFQPYSYLDAYALNALKRIIKNQISKEIKSKNIKLSDNGILRTLEKKELEKALIANQFSKQEIQIYSLAVQAFKELFEELYPATNSEGGRARKPPTASLDDRQLSQIAKRYNQHIKRLELPSKLANAQDIKQMLSFCVQIIRNKTSLQSVSIDDQGTAEIVDFTSNPLEEMLKEEDREDLIEIKQIVLRELEALEGIAKRSLILWMGLGINQEDFLAVLNLTKQYQVARKFQGYQKTILRGVSQFVFQKYEQKELKDKEIDRIVENALNFLKEYLKNYSRNLFEEILLEIVNTDMNQQEKYLLKTGVETLKTSLKEQRNNEPNESGDRAIKQKIETTFRDRVEQQLQISLADFKSARESIARFVETYLQENTAILY